VLEVELSDGVGVDLDVHLLTALDPKSCVARHDTTIGPIAVQAGKRYVVADTWSNSSGVPKPGPYSISITFASSCKPKAEVCNGDDDDCDGTVDEGKLCDDGLACTDDLCGPSGACEVEPDGKGCFIDGGCVGLGALEPGDTCASCAATAPTFWSPADGIACDDGAPCIASSTARATPDARTPRGWWLLALAVGLLAAYRRCRYVQSGIGV
jgi:hypothetical protein